jgi:NTE family protein
LRCLSVQSLPSSDPAPPQRLGLALSGGGFRASFFHLGVLSRLADLGLLRSVSVISTVSGGTIVGAFYYLHLKRLLETVADPTDDDYRQLVQRVQAEFLDGVRKNLRGRILLNPFKNYLMAISWRYSRSDRIGDLYDKYLFKRAWGKAPGKRSFLRDLQIQLRWLVAKPLAYKGGERFDPWDHNEQLAAKLPILVMNATSLNTGHNWRFEAVRMGEPAPEDPTAKALLESIDVNERLEQGYFKLPDQPQREPAVPRAQQNFPLGLAVAASACVPGVFHPLAISRMYGHRRVQLVDGGVHDNQGIQALFDMECDALIISDASGLMADRRRPAPLLLQVAMRSMNIYGTRVRIEQLVRASEEKPSALMHLLSDVSAGTVEPGRTLAMPESSPLTAYEINRDVQRRLARIRTDLDAFTDTEAYSLMYSGYRMSAYELDEWKKRYPAVGRLIEAEEPDPAKWCFEPVADLAGNVGLTDSDRYMRLLDAGKSLFLKPLLATLPPTAGFWASIGVGVAAAGGAITAIAFGGIDGWFDLPVSNWWWFAAIALIPALLSIAAILQLASGKLYLWMGSASRLRRP